MSRICEVIGCREQVLPVPDKARKSRIQNKPGLPLMVCYPTKERKPNLCFFHRIYPEGVTPRVVSGPTGYQRNIYFSKGRSK